MIKSSLFININFYNQCEVILFIFQKTFLQTHLGRITQAAGRFTKTAQSPPPVPAAQAAHLTKAPGPF